ncbi:unnamed protein product [Rotaria sp. Silwood2]|nr:unnamed protein product [Rotaria sp. Silwood2]CAF3889904.1 unnamed protein product [Rotaria sp. Silwood2]
MTQATIYAFIHFTNLDSCTNPSTMPDAIAYTLRMPENGSYYYRAQSVKIDPNIYRWKRAPEDFCRDTSTTTMYTSQFLGIQYFIDLSIIQYSTNISQDPSSIFMNHFGCPAHYYDTFQSEFGFFIPILFSLTFMMTFMLNVGYIVEERRNKAKEYLRIFGLRTWLNNLVWITRSMCIYIVLSSILTGFSVLVLSSSNATSTSVGKAVFNYAHWTLIWTILFVYSIQLSSFSIFFGQFFSRREVCALLGHNGAGKTTITFILVGMLEATSGCVILQDLDHRIHIQQTRKMIGFCPQYDPYNRRLIWTIIQKMKDAGKCVILTTHFLEEADILSDRIAIMSHGQLQASGTPDFLKKQTEYEYRLFIDKQDVCNTENVAQFIRQHVQTVVLERETSSELVFGIKRGATQNIGRLIRGLDEQCQQLAINGYGLSMTTIEEVFLRFIITDVP